MEVTEREMTLRDYWRVLSRRKWYVICAVGIAVLSSLVLTALTEPVYQAEAQMLVQTRGNDALFQSDLEIRAQDLNRAIQTEIQVLEGERVRSRVQDDLQLDRRPPAVSASAVGQTDVVEARVRSTDPRTAQILADAYVSAYIVTRREQSVEALLDASAEVQNKITELQTQVDVLPPDDPQRQALLAQQAAFKLTLDQLQVDAALRTGGASVVRSAELPDDPVEPQPLRSAALAAVVGLLLGLGAAFLVDYLDNSVKSEDDLERLSTLPVLAVVPVDPPPDNRPVALSRPADYAVETYRGLRTNVQFLGLDRPIRIVQVTSSIAGEGKTTTATNLAVVLAQAGHRVVVVDADLRRPMLHEVFAEMQSPGLTGLLLGDDMSLVIRHLAIDDGSRLDVVTSGEAPPNPSEILSSDRMKAVLAELAGRYDYVIVDSAPILPVADSLALSGGVDAVLLVAQADRASSSNVSDSLERLGRVGAPLIGFVLNRATGAERDGYRYGGYGHYEYRPQPKRDVARPLPPPVDRPGVTT